MNGIFHDLRISNIRYLTANVVFFKGSHFYNMVLKELSVRVSESKKKIDTSDTVLEGTWRFIEFNTFTAFGQS